MITKERPSDFKEWTLEDFYKAFEEMWLWIAETDGDKKEYLKQAGYEEIWPVCGCFACEYTIALKNDDCEEDLPCPVKEWRAWNEDRMECSACVRMKSSPFRLWQRSENQEERRKYAFQIANMEWIKEEPK